MSEVILSKKDAILTSLVDIVLPDLYKAAKEYSKKRHSKQIEVESLETQIKSAKDKELVWMSIMITLGILGFALSYYVFIGSAIALILMIGQYSKKTKIKERYENQKRVYENMKFEWSQPIDKIGGANLTFTQYPFEDGSILIDEKMITVRKELVYKELENTDMLESEANQLDTHIKKLPCIYSPENLSETKQISSEKKNVEIKLFDGETKIRDYVSNIRREFESTIDTYINIGIVDINDSQYAAIRNDIIKDNFLILKNDNSESQKKIDSILGKTKQAKSDYDVDEYSISLRKRIRDIDYKLSDIRKHSIEVLSDEKVFALTDTMHTVGHNFYCPNCNKTIIDDLKSRNYDLMNGEDYEPVSFIRESRMKLVDWEKGTWECSLCGTITKAPIPINKLYDEVFMPAANYLFEENSFERVKLYGELRNKYTSFKDQFEKERHALKRDHRKIINFEKDRMIELTANVKLKEQLILKLTEHMEDNEYILENELDDLKIKANQIVTDLETKNQVAIARVDDEVYQLNKDMIEENDKLVGYARKDQERRDKVQRDILDEQEYTNRILRR